MKSTNKEISYGARPVADQEAGRVLRPVPRMDASLATGRDLFNDIQCNVDNSQVPTSGSGVCGRNLPKKTSSTLNVVQFNICGLSTKKDEFKVFLHKHKIHVALLQETQHVADTNLDITGYTHYPCDCKDCQGAITYIRNDVTGKVTNINTSQPTIIQKAEIWHTGIKYAVYNLYNPPRNHMDLTPTFSESQFSKTMIAGDFNGRSPSWGYTDENPTGKSIEAFCNTTNLFRMQDCGTSPTHFHRVHKTLNRPDLTLVSADLMQTIKTKVTDGIGSSDHFPIKITIETPCKKKYEQWTRWNFKKANWEQFKSTTDALLQEIDLSNPDVNTNTKDVTEAILTAAKKCIPRGCRSKYKPFWNDNLAQAVQTREEARKKYMEDDSPMNRTEFMRTSAFAQKEILSSKRQKFHETCENIDLAKEGAKAWSMLQNLSGENKISNQKPIVNEGDTIADDQKKAERQNKFFASVNKSHKLTEDDKKMLKDLKSKEKSLGPGNQLFDENFSVSELKKAMRKLKSRKCPGPDGIHNEMLTHL